jgi:ceramide glucosyltransferase
VFPLAVIAASLFAGSLIYCALVVIATRRYLAQIVTRSENREPISVLKALAGADDGLHDNLRSFFTQDYPEFELLFAVRDAADPAIAIVRDLEKEFPDRATRLIITGEPPYPNAKVFSLDSMLAEARYDLLVMSDSDIRVPRDFLKSIAAEFSDPQVALATCPYRAIGGPSLWSRLEAEGMNTEFLAGLFVARMIEGVKFAVGPTVVARKNALQAIGGFPVLKDYLAEDFVLGKFAAKAGFGVILSRHIVEHRIGSQSFRANCAHRLRWARSTRRSRPFGYLGQLFTYPLPLGLLLWALHPDWWPAVILALTLRSLAAWSTCVWILKTKPRYHLLLAQDLLSFLFYLAGFFGNTIVWRGRRYYLYPDGRFEPVRDKL